MTANPNDASNYDDCGFDISHDNTGLNFLTLGGQGARKYCVAKVSEGTTFRDPQFRMFITELKASPIARLGVYHFAHHGDPIGQMQFFIETFTSAMGSVPNPPKFLFMLDVERSANPPQETDGLTMVQYLQSLGISPIIYCGYDFWSQAYPELANCPHMVAAYNDNPISAIPWRIPSADTYGWDLWQYTDGESDPSKGGPWHKSIPGGSVPMDLSCFNLKKHGGTLEAWWDAQLASTKQP
jgi:GH25 family lysozyme M1 (1,4-beta-N-acetylmuramidase)